MAQQEALELVPGLDTAVDGVFARPRQVADRFVGRLGYPHRTQLSGARALGQLNAVTSIGLDSVARTPRNLRRGNDFAEVAPL